MALQSSFNLSFVSEKQSISQDWNCICRQQILIHTILDQQNPAIKQNKNLPLNANLAHLRHSIASYDLDNGLKWSCELYARIHHLHALAQSRETIKSDEHYFFCELSSVGKGDDYAENNNRNRCNGF